MKIAMIGQKGIPALFGGIERHVDELSCRLAKKQGYSVFVYARAYYTSKKIRKYKGVNVVHLPCLRTKHLDAITHIFLSTLHSVFVIKADIIHYHGVGSALCILIPKIFRPRAKVVFTFHCRDYFHKKWGRIAQTFLKIGERIGCYFADEVIPVSMELQKYIKGRYNRQTNFIPHGVNQCKNISANLIKKWGLKKDNYILSVSRLIRHKGIHYLIDAYQGMQTDKKLVIVGPSFYTEDYERDIKSIARNNKNVIFLGEQHGKALKELYSNAYIFVNPSEQEGLPLSVLEAAGFGRPLLLSDIRIHKEMFNDLPFFFKNKNVRNLKQSLEFLLSHTKQARQKARKIKNYSKKEYNWDRVVEKVVLKYS
ncbi:MAG: glycosyltransferase family 4 protein [bacterium]